MRTWSVLTGSQRAIVLQDHEMRCELVQQVEPSNLLMYEEYEDQAIAPCIGAVTVTVVRWLLLQMIFETANGYITLFYSMDPHRLANWPQACDPVPNRSLPLAAHGR